MNKLRLLLIGLTSLLSLTACGGVVFSCPPIRDYSPAYQEMLAVRLEDIHEGDIIIETLKDYKVLRDQIRKCD